MKTPEELARHIVGPGALGDFAATRHGSIARLEPLNSRAKLWLDENIGQDAQWDDDAVLIDMRYFPDIADGIIAAGLKFEHDRWPSDRKTTIALD